ncbi:MAG: acetyl-CoA carboxylase biotin carboxyl carrier protein subunit [Chloroflexota bacterium]
MIFHYSDGETSWQVRLERAADGTLRAFIGDDAYTVRAAPVADGGVLLDWGTGRTVIHTARDGEARHAHVDGHAHTLKAVDPRARRRAAGPAGDLTAQMPGQVVDVLVSEGDTVAAGQTLVILEAMKMEIRVSAPTGGTVKRVMVQRGDVVERGQPLVEVVTA